jgi:hypothetical protein
LHIGQLGVGQLWATERDRKWAVQPGQHQAAAAMWGSGNVGLSIAPTSGSNPAGSHLLLIVCCDASRPFRSGNTLVTTSLGSHVALWFVGAGMQRK